MDGGESGLAALDSAQPAAAFPPPACWRPASPPELLDLHLATHHTRVVQKAGEISFLGRRWGITPGENKQVTIVEQPGGFQVISRPPTLQAPQWPDILAEYRL